MEQIGLVILGAIIGAAATGGIQTLIAKGQRKERRKVAARVILGDLYLTELFVKWVLNQQIWPPGLDIGRPLNTWKEFRADIAADVTPAEWVRVDNVYSLLHQIWLGVGVTERPEGEARALAETLLERVKPARQIVLACAAEPKERDELVEVFTES